MPLRRRKPLVCRGFLTPRVGLESTTLRLTARPTGVTQSALGSTEPCEVTPDAGRSPRVGRKSGRKFAAGGSEPRLRRDFATLHEVTPEKRRSMEAGSRRPTSRSGSRTAGSSDARALSESRVRHARKCATAKPNGAQSSWVRKDVRVCNGHALDHWIGGRPRRGRGRGLPRCLRWRGRRRLLSTAGAKRDGGSISSRFAERRVENGEAARREERIALALGAEPLELVEARRRLLGKQPLVQTERGSTT